MTQQITRSIINVPIIKYCIYARKSMEAEERQALSIDSQLKEMKLIAERDQLNIIDVKTESHSAKQSGQRPVFNEIIQDLKKGKFNAILTWNPDRLSRNAGDLGHLVDLMDKELLLEIRTFGQTFSNSPNDKFLLMILCSQAKLENDNKGINVQRGLRARVESGLWPSMAPMGYLDSKMKDKLCEKELDPDRAPIIKKIYEKVVNEDYSTHEVVRWLKEIGFKSPNGKYLNLSTVQLILKRPFYYGYFEYPLKSGKWYKGKHIPIITKKLYMDAQEKIRNRTNKRKYFKLRGSPFSFLRMICCGTCGSGISAEEKHKTLKTSNEEVIYRYYVCSRSRNRDCREKYINEQQLMDELTRVIDRVELDLIGMRQFLETEIDKWYRVHKFLTGESLADLQARNKEHDLREYAKIIFKDGRIDEQREILKHLKGRLILKDKKIYLDTINENSKL